MDIREEIKILLLKEKYTITEIAEELGKIKGKKVECALYRKWGKLTLLAF
jgi:hypothetical protein